MNMVVSLGLWNQCQSLEVLTLKLGFHKKTKAYVMRSVRTMSSLL